VDAGCGANSPSGVAGSAAGIPLPRTDGGFIGYLQNKAAKLSVPKFLPAGELEHIT
jgi:hypothetical protein